MSTTASIEVLDLASSRDAQGISSTHVLPSPFDKSNPPPVLLTQGAEALVYQTTFLDSNIRAALKFRPSKPYRHPLLDQRLTKQRVLSEARILVKLSGLKRDGINVPALLSLEWDVARKVKALTAEQKENSQLRSVGQGAWILMEWIEGSSVKQLLRDYDSWLVENAASISEEEQKQAAAAAAAVKALLRRIGRAVAAMHSKGGVVHGDLTSSNIMVRPSSEKAVLNGDHPIGSHPPDTEGEIVLIDFGLAAQSIQDEDRAVDLYVLERAFGSTHPRQEGWFDAEVLQHPDGYKGSFKGANVVLKRLEEVRLRGRKRSMIG